MKHFYLNKSLAIAAVAFALPVNMARAEGDYSENRIDALHYRPGAKTYAASAYVEAYTPDTEKTLNNGVETSSSTKQETAAGVSLTYGIVDTLEVEVAESYLFNRQSKTTNTKTGAQATTSSLGLADPTFSINYRYLGGLTGSRFGSVFGSITPAIGTAKSATADQNGNNISSSTSLAIGTSYFWVFGVSELELRAVATDYTSGNSTPQGAGSAVSSSTYATGEGAVYYRWHVSETFYFEPAAVLDAPYSVSSSNPNHNPTLKQTSQYPFRLTPSLDVGWRAASKLVIDLSYSYTNYTESANTTAGKATNSYTYPTAQGLAKLAANYEI